MITRLGESLEASVAETYERYRHYKEKSGLVEIPHALKRGYLHHKIGRLLSSPVLREGGRTNTVEVFSDTEGMTINIEGGVIHSLGDYSLFNADVDVSKNYDGSIAHVAAHFQKYSGGYPDHPELHYSSSNIDSNLSTMTLLGCVRYAQQELNQRAN